MTVNYQITFIFVYMDSNYICVRYIKVLMIRRGLVATFVLLGYLVFVTDVSGQRIASVIQGSNSAKHSLTLEDGDR